MNDSDQELLRCFTDRRSEEAFAQIVRRHVDLVYSAALRQVHSREIAQEVAQSVFADGHGEIMPNDGKFH